MAVLSIYGCVHCKATKKMVKGGEGDRGFMNHSFSSGKNLFYSSQLEKEATCQREAK